MNVEAIWTLGRRLVGMQVLRQGGGEIMPSVITTQMFQGPFLLTDVRAHVGKHKTVIFRRDNKSLQWEFSLVWARKARGQKHQLLSSDFLLLVTYLTSWGMTLGWAVFAILSKLSIRTYYLHSFPGYQGNHWAPENNHAPISGALVYHIHGDTVWLSTEMSHG